MKHNYDSLRLLDHVEAPSAKVAFDRKELTLIMRIYGRMVSLGEWRDYGISMLKDFSVFSIYRHASEYPIYRIKKTIQHSNIPVVFSIILMDGRVLKRSNDLATALRA